MGINGSDNSLNNLKDGGECRKVARTLNFNVDATEESKDKSVNEQLRNGNLDGADDRSMEISSESTCEPFGGSSYDEEDNRNGNLDGADDRSMEISSESTCEPFGGSSYDEEDNHHIVTSSVTEENTSSQQQDVGYTHQVDYQQSKYVKHSPKLDISRDWSISPSRHPRRGLGHSITAPVGTHKNHFFESHGVAISRSMTEKKDAPRHDLKLDRLSEREKKKLIVELVKIQNDGTVEVDLTKNPPVASELLEFQSVGGATPNVNYFINDSRKPIPRLKIAVLVVGTRGDVQPFLAMSKRLQEFGHHVRLATHTNFRTFVESAGVSFYPLGGDPRVLAGYMAKNKGLIPSAPGQISVQRKQLKAIIESLLPACTEPDIKSGEPFTAEAIIANPPAYGHAHVAEALGVPLHIFFTMPWTPTHEFPHPLARVPQSAGYWLSYIVVDLLIWWGIRGYINEFRKKKLGLSPIAYFSTYHGSISHFPTGYMWSPQIVPKPSDWGPQVDVVGYCFLNLGSKYKSPEDFSQWIQKGSRPIYIGFGSMLLEDPEKITDIILEALKNTGQRGIIGRGWGNLGSSPQTSDNVFFLEDCPHDWLFPQCSAVVHHGGAGTTATGLRAGCPTTIVPFFGDQFFWGERIHQRGLGPAPIPIGKISVEALSDAIEVMLQPEVKSLAMELAKVIENEDGVASAVDAFHRHLPPELPVSEELPDEDDHPNMLQCFFTKIGRVCSLTCG